MLLEEYVTKVVEAMQMIQKKQYFVVPAKLYRIGEVTSNTPYSRQTIHNYTIMGLIKEARWTRGGHRLYDETVFEKLSRIENLKKTRTLSQIKRIFLEQDLNSDMKLET